MNHMKLNNWFCKRVIGFQQFILEQCTGINVALASINLGKIKFIVCGQFKTEAK